MKSMYWDIISAEHEGDCRIRVRFRNGKSGVVALKTLVDKGGVFSSLRDMNVFKAFTIDPEWHVLSWYEESTGERALSRVAEDHSPYGS